MTTIYIDSVFVLNTLVNNLLLVAVARLSGVRLRRLRFFLAASLGGFYAVATFLPGCAFLTQPVFKLVSGILLLWVAFGGERTVLRLGLLFFLVSCGFGGLILALGLLSGSGGRYYVSVDGRVLVFSAAIAYTLLTIVFRSAAEHGGQAGGFVPVRIALGGREISLTAFCDSGNCLRDPATGRPILLVSGESLTGLWADGVPFSAAELQQPVQLLERLHGKGFCLVTYCAVGIESGLLLAFCSDAVTVAGVRHPKLFVALSPTRVGSGAAVALWGGEEKKGAEQFAHEVQAVAAVGQMGAAASKQNLLHRWQRHPATPAAKGSGGGAVAAHRRGARSPDSH